MLPKLISSSSSLAVRAKRNTRVRYGPSAQLQSKNLNSLLWVMASPLAASRYSSRTLASHQRHSAGLEVRGRHVAEAGGLFLHFLDAIPHRDAECRAKPGIGDADADIDRPREQSIGLRQHA